MASVSADRLAQYRQELTSQTSSIKKVGYFKMSEPSQIPLRILPGVAPGEPNKDFFVRTAQHFNLVNGKKIPVTCLRVNDVGGERTFCPACDAFFKAKKLNDKVGMARFTASQRFVMAVVPREGEDKGKILFWSAPKMAMDQILAHMSDPDYGDITHPTEGRDVKVTRTANDQAPWMIIPIPKSTAIMPTENEVADILLNLPDLSRFRQVLTREIVEKLISGELTNPYSNNEVAEDDSVVLPAAALVKAPVAAENTEASSAKKKSRPNLDSLKASLED